MPHFWLARSNSSLLSSVTRAASIHSYYSNIVFDFVFPPERIRSGRGTEGEPNGERQSDFQRGMSTPSPPPLVRRCRRRRAATRCSLCSVLATTRSERLSFLFRLVGDAAPFSHEVLGRESGSAC